MTIKLKLSLKQLGSLVYAFNSLQPLDNREREVRVARAILDKVALRLRKKYLDEESKVTLFSQKKKFVFNMEFYEAHFLERFILIAEPATTGDYDRNVLNLIKSTLNQQMQ